MIGGIVVRAFRFLHTADLHLNSPFVGISESLPSSLAQRVKQASDMVFDRVVQVAIDKEVDFLVLAGDAFDAATVSVRAQFALIRGCERLLERGIAVFLAHGNHDPLTASDGHFELPSNVHVFPALSAKHARLSGSCNVKWRPDAHTNVQLSGFSYGSGDMAVNAAPLFHRETDVDYAIGLYHGTVGNGDKHAPYYPTTTSDLSARDFDIWCLGHIHKPNILHPQNPLILYAGCPQGRDAGEADERGCYVIDVDERGHATPQFVSTSDVVWRNVYIDVTGLRSMSDLRECMRNTIHSRIGTLEPTLLRISLHGSSNVLSAMDEKSMTEAFRDELALSFVNLYLLQVDIRVTPILDLQVLCESEGYLGECLRIVEDWESKGMNDSAAYMPLLQSLTSQVSTLSQEDIIGATWLDFIAEVRQQILQLVQQEVAK